MLSDNDLLAIEQRYERTTPPPWTLHGCGKCAQVWAEAWADSAIANFGSGSSLEGIKPLPLEVERANGDFAAHARTDVPNLVAAFRAEREENARLRAEIEILQAGEVIENQIVTHRNATIARLGKALRHIARLATQDVHSTVLADCLRAIEVRARKALEDIDMETEEEVTPLAVREDFLRTLDTTHLLCQPLPIRIEQWPTEIMAFCPELESYGNGATEEEALNDLRLNIVELYNDLHDYPDEKLGPWPLRWKQMLRSAILEINYE